MVKIRSASWVEKDDPMFTGRFSIFSYRNKIRKSIEERAVLSNIKNEKNNSEPNPNPEKPSKSSPDLDKTNHVIRGNLPNLNEELQKTRDQAQKRREE